MSKHALTKLKKLDAFYGENGFNIYGDFGESLCSEFAESHAAVMAVAFAEWKDRCTDSEGKNFNNEEVFTISHEDDDACYTYPDLYQYFINNVYNK